MLSHMEKMPSPRRAQSAELTSMWLSAATLYFVLAASTIYLTSNGKTIATVWPSNAVLVALLLIGPQRRWKTVLSAGLVGNLAANWITRGSIAGPLLYSLANGVEVYVAVALMGASNAHLQASASTRKLFRFVLAAGIAAPLVGGLIGASTATLIYDQPFGDAFTAWVLSDGLGLVIFTPVFASLFNGELAESITDQLTAKRLETLGLLVLTATITWLVFFVAALPALFLLYAPVMLVTFRAGPLGTKMAVMIVTVIGGSATATGLGPLALMTGDPAAQAHMFQIALAALMLTCLPVAAALSERGRLTQELSSREQEASRQAVTDALTGALNRRGFERAARDMLARSAAKLTFVAIDVDRFKAINDCWGHQFGDRVLREIASVLQANTRPSDIVGRLGGDEFALLLSTDEHELPEAVCSRIQNSLRAMPIKADAKTDVMIRISCGLALTERGDSFEDAYGRADQALYQAKFAGRCAIGSTAMA